MPKQSSRKKKKSERGKRSDSLSEADIIERSRLPDPNEPSIIIGTIFDMPENNPVKSEELIYPDTRFQHSTTLFPAAGVEETSEEVPSETTKRCHEDESISTTLKKIKVSDSPKRKSTISDDCMIIDNSPKKVKIDFIDLTEYSHPTTSVLCSPVRTCFLENRVPNYHAGLQTNGDVHVKVEPSEKTYEVNAVDGSTDRSYPAIQADAEQNKASESNSETNSDKSCTDNEKTVSPPIENSSHIQLKTERAMPSEGIKEKNYDDSSVEPLVHSPSRIQIKTEKRLPNESNNEVDFDESHIEQNRSVNSQVPASNIVSVCKAKCAANAMTSVNHLNNDVPIKMEQNENYIVSDNSTSISNLSSDVNLVSNSPVDRPIKSEKHIVNNAEAQENVVCDKNKNDIDSSTNYLLNATQVKSEPERMDLEENSCNEKSQSYESTSVVSSETLITYDLNQASISSFTDDDIFSGDSQLHEPGTFRTPLIKYLKCITKFDDLEISNALSALNNLIENKGNINAIKTEVISDLTDLQDESELCLANDNQLNETSNSRPLEAKKIPHELSSVSFRQENTNLTKSDGIANINSSLHSSFDPVAISNEIIDESMFQSLHQIRLPENKQIENMSSTSDINELNTERTIENSENFSKGLPVPHENVLKRAQDVLFNPPAAYGDTFETPPKKLKISEDASISKSDKDKKLSYEKSKKNDTRLIGNPPDHNLKNILGSDFPSTSFDSSPDSSNLKINMLTPRGDCRNRSPPVCSVTSLQNQGYRHMVNASSPKDPRLARNRSPTLDRDGNSQKQLNSFNISQTYHPLGVSEATKSSIHPHMKQTLPVSATHATRNSSSVPSPAETFYPTVNALKIQVVKPILSKINSSYPTDFNQQTLKKNGHVIAPSLASESTSLSVTHQHNPNSTVQGVKSCQPLSFPHLPTNTSSPYPQSVQLVSQEIRPSISSHSTLTHTHYSSKSVNLESMLNPSLQVCNTSSPLPIMGQSDYINKTHRAVNNLNTPNQSSSEFCAPQFSSLLPKQLKESIGRNIINTSDIYLIIIERNMNWFHEIDKKIVPKISEIGGKLLQVRDDYANHLMYYNTYFPLLLFECFNKISMAIKDIKAKEVDKNICKVVHLENKTSYVSFTCDSFINCRDMKKIPKYGHIVLVKFAAIPVGSVKMLGYVCSSATRDYSHENDNHHEMLKYVDVNKRTDLKKVKIVFYTVFGICGINLDLPIHISKLTNVKKTVVLNDALNKLQRSPLRNVILNPRNHNIKSITLPHTQDRNAMTAVVQTIVKSLNPSSPQMTVVKSARFTDPFLAIVRIVEDIQRSKIPGKILVCVRTEVLSQMGMNLIETSSNLIIINRERESLHDKLQSRVLDVIISRLSNAENIPNDEAKAKVLREAQVLLAVTGTCFYKDVQGMVTDLAYCIIHDAHSFTEPESLLPLLYGIQHLILFGDPDESCHVSSKYIASLGYKSLFHRAYNSC